MPAARCRIVRFLAALVLALSSVGAVALDPSVALTQYGHTTLSVTGGVLPAEANVIAQAADGYLWVGTNSGLFRFDGVRFVHMDWPTGSELPSERILSLLVTRDGMLWIGTGTGLARWNNNHLTSFKDGARINAIVEAKDGTVWFMRSRIPAPPFHGICRIEAGQPHCLGPAEGVPLPWATTATASETGLIWAASSSDLIALGDASPRIVPIPALASKAGLGGVAKLADAGNGDLWVGLFKPGPGGGLQRLHDGHLAPVTRPGFDSSTLPVSTLYADPHGALWIGTAGDGLYRLVGDRVEHFTTADGLLSSDVDGFFADAEGSLWVLSSKGVEAFRELPIVAFSKREGLGAERATFVQVDGDAIWVGNRGVLDHVTHDAQGTHVESIAFPGSTSFAMARMPDGAWLVGIDRGLWRLQDGRFSALVKDGDALAGIVTSIAVTGGDAVVTVAVGTGKFAVVKSDGHSVQPLPSTSHPDVAIRDPQGQVWVSDFDGTTARYVDGRLEPASQAAANPRDTFLAVDRAGGLLFSSATGLERIAGSQRIELGLRNGLPCTRVNGVLEARDGTVWMSLACGVVALSREELRRWLADPAALLRFDHYDVLDGARAGVATGKPAIVEDSAGRIWFASGDLVSVLDPHRLRRNRAPIPTHIESVSADRHAFAVGAAKLALPPEVHSLQIDYTATSFETPTRVRFRYRLEGFDADWQDAGARRQAVYTDLPPGPYRFDVVASRTGATWDAPPESLAFTIAPRFWQTPWFVVLCVLAALGLLASLHYLNSARLASRIVARRSDRLRERERVARDLHDSLLQDMGALSINLHSLATRDESAEALREELRFLGDATDRALDDARDRVAGLRGESGRAGELGDALEAAAEQLQALDPTGFSLEIVGAPKALAPAAVDDIESIAKEAIGNAFRHARAGEIDVRIVYGASSLELVVTDDGVGLPVAVTAVRKQDRRHWGLQGMRERAAELGATLRFETPGAGGTCVRLVVPARTAYARPGRDAAIDVPQ